MNRDEFNIRFGILIAHYRKKNKMSQGNFAKEMSLSRVSIGMIEIGSSSTSFFNAVKMSRFLNFNLGDIYSPLSDDLFKTVKEIQTKRGKIKCLQKEIEKMQNIVS